MLIRLAGDSPKSCTPDRLSSRQIMSPTANLATSDRFELRDRLGRSDFGGSWGGGEGVTPIRTVWSSDVTSTVVLNGWNVLLSGIGAIPGSDAGISATTKYRPPLS